MNRKWLAVVCAAVVALSLASVAFASNPVKILVNGDELKLDVPAVVEGRVMAPVRSLAEALGAGVEWDAASRTVRITGGQASGGGELSAVNRRIALLEKALLPETPKEVAALWAKGVKERNGALQFALLEPELRRICEPGFERVGWVTGVSSPWVDSYRITDKGEQEGARKFEVSFHMMTSTGDAGTYTAKILVGKSRDDISGLESWRISEINYPYQEVYAMEKAELPAYRLILPLPAGWSWSLERTTGEVILMDEEGNLLGKIQKLSGPFLPNHSETLSEKKVTTALGEVRLSVLKRSYPAASGMNDEWEEVHALVPLSENWLDLAVRVKEGDDSQHVADLVEMMLSGISKM